MILHKPTKRVIDILNTISKNSEKLTFSEISKILDIPKSTLSPILKTLVELELISLNPLSQTYTIGLTAFQIGQVYLKNINGLDIIKSHMTIITNICNETCQLGIEHNNEVLYLLKVESTHPIKLMSSIGRNLPLYCTGLGRVLLCNYTPTEIRNLYTNPLSKFTEKTITDIDNLLKIVEQAKEENYAKEVGEITVDTCCIAVPIIINNKIQAALGISLPLFKATDDYLNNLIELLQEHSKLITDEFLLLNLNSII